MSRLMLTLKHFILQQQAIRLYRKSARLSRHIPNPEVRKETMRWIRVEFDELGHTHELDAFESQVKGIERRLRQWLPSM